MRFDDQSLAIRDGFSRKSVDEELGVGVGCSRDKTGSFLQDMPEPRVTRSWHRSQANPGARGRHRPQWLTRATQNLLNCPLAAKIPEE